MLKVYMPHQNLGCLGFEVFGRYFDLSLPWREGFQKTWSNMLRVYWKHHTGRRAYFLLPGFKYILSR